MSAPGVILSLAELEAHDPKGGRGAECGKRWRCPLPECNGKTERDLSADLRSGAWKCFRCGAAGKLREFWEEKTADTSGRLGIQRRAPKTARRAILRPELPEPGAAPVAPKTNEERRAKWHELTWALVPLQETPGAAYLAWRGLPLELCQAARVKFSPAWFGHPAAIFPAYDSAGRLIGAQGRFTDGHSKPKALTFGAFESFGGAFWTPGAREAPVLALTEAPIDALSLALAGLPSVAVFGSNLPDWMPGALYRRRVWVASDAEPDKGDVTAEKWSGALESFGARCRRLRPDALFSAQLGQGVKDWNEALLVLGAQDLRELLSLDLGD